MKKALMLLLIIPMLSGMKVRAQQNSGTAEAVYVVGEVATPQGVAYTPYLTLKYAVAMAGGVLRGTDLKRVVVYRVKSGRQWRDRITVNFNDIRKGRKEVFPLQPYDIVCVPSRRAKGERCSGLVLAAGMPTLRVIK
jgi:protein involved in polysaccharide export with SLBB domain